MLMAQTPLSMQEGSVLRQVFPVHDQVLPVHIDQQPRSIDAQAPDALDSIEAGSDIAHQDIHSWFTILMLQEDFDALGSGMSDNFGHPFDKEIPGVGVVALKVIVIALGPGPDNEIGAQGGGQIDTPL